MPRRHTLPAALPYALCTRSLGSCPPEPGVDAADAHHSARLHARSFSCFEASVDQPKLPLPAQIKVKTLTGKEIEIDIEPEDTVARIKERVEEKEGIPPPQQRLIFGGKQMADEKKASEYKIEGGTVLHLVLALRGGC